MFILSAYIDAKVIEVENDEGIMEEGVFIPIAKNAITVDAKTKFISSWCYMTERHLRNWSHYLKLKVDKTAKSELDKLGIKPPYLGWAKVNRKMLPYHQQNDKVQNISNDE